MILGVLKETKINERRIALSPEVVKLLVKKEFRVQIESGVGLGSNFSDEEYRDAGAYIVSKSDIYQTDVVLKVDKPTAEEASQFKNGMMNTSLLYSNTHSQNRK